MVPDSIAAAFANPPVQTEGRLPDFLVIGAAKSGTTTLYSYLDRHPDIYLSTLKEPCFFSDDEVWGRGLEWYSSLFESAQPNQLCGEASTTYTRWPHTADAASRIAEICPSARLVYIMRHPVDRAYSHYGHHMRMAVTKTFEQAIADSSIYVDCSRYKTQIQRHVTLVPGRPVFLMTLEELKASPNSTLHRLQRFLGVKPSDLTGVGIIRSNEGGNRPLANKRLARWMARLGRTPVLAGAKSCLPRQMRSALFCSLEQSPLARYLVRDYCLPAMQPETREKIMASLIEEIEGVEAMMGRRLSEWGR